MLLPLIAILTGISINYITGGLPFSTLLCIFAGIFVMIPIFLNIHYPDIIHRKNKTSLLIKSIIIHRIIIPIIAILIGLTIFHNNISLLFGLVLLALTSGGGLTMHRIQKTQGDIKTGIQLFVIHMIFFTGIFFLYEYLVQTIGISLSSGLSCSLQTPTISCIGNNHISPLNGIIVLILFPFIISRIINVSKKIRNRIQQHIKTISQIATFIIISYIFSLEYLQTIFHTSFTTIFLATIGVIVFYISTIIINYITRIKTSYNQEHISGFRIGTSRFITMGMIFSFLYTQIFGTDFMIIFIIAYLVQILSSLFLTKFILTQKKHNVIQ